MIKSKKTLQKFQKQNLVRAKSEDILKFLNDYQEILGAAPTKTKAISLRVPEKLLSAFKLKAKNQDTKYQSMIVRLMREWLSQQR